MKKYIEVKENPGKTTHLKVETYYDLGGMNYFNGKTDRRGYYLSVTPVERSRSSSGLMMESFICFSGVKDLILEVKRKSAKAEEKAEKMAEEMEDRLIEYVCKKAGLEIQTASSVAV